MAGSDGTPPLQRFEESMQRDIERIRATVTDMAGLVERALKDAVDAFLSGDRRLAFAVILRDRLVDEKEQELDRMCLGFLVRQQPAGGPLRMAYAAIRISLELERMGDYAESIARQALRIAKEPPDVPRDRYVEMAGLTISMLQDAVQAFEREDPELARRTIGVENTVDTLKSDLTRDLVSQYRDNRLTFEALDPLMQVNRRLERASDQARNICHEVIYMCTGQVTRHLGAETVRILFVDEEHGSLSQMAEALGNALAPPGFVFASAGVEPRRLSAATIQFMQGKGVDLSRVAPRAIHEIPDLDQYQVVVALADRVSKTFPRKPRRLVFFDWRYKDPARDAGPDGAAAAHETTYERLRADVADLVAMIAGT